MTTITSPGMMPYLQSVRLPIEQVISELRDLLGAKLVAYIGNVGETRAVRQWAEGSRAVQGENAQRLRTAYQIAGLIAEAEESKEILQLWFQGANPQLDDVSPARILREHRPDSDEVIAVMAAAKTFTRLG
ncbi:hypothetical protein [Nesterenkonia aerolata]|uniref:Antitoxin Xre/MbcA/ParS-like toxin-binding domain-containing protein n=1 Tax=Nesterenkonia aerolata TaxID=3074079 RepID=A0ABU2DR58_9MICC|nr:hypothetical protein [Nesterenkonia sp. LY-0111]MDR8018976.1 hypothetical protein [Nesterenkonia sp. LY-0111]